MCTICKLSKSRSEYNRRGDDLQPQCRECGKQKSKEYYAANKEYHKQQAAERKRRNVKFTSQYIYDLLKSRVPGYWSAIYGWGKVIIFQNLEMLHSHGPKVLSLGSALISLKIKDPEGKEFRLITKIEVEPMDEVPAEKE